MVYNTSNIPREPLHPVEKIATKQPYLTSLQFKFRLVKTSKEIVLDKLIILKYACLAIAYMQLIMQMFLLMMIPYVFVRDHWTLEGKQPRPMRIEEIVKNFIQYSMMLLTNMFTLTLVIGLHKNRPNLVKAFLLYSGIVFFLSVLMCIGVFLYLTRVDEFQAACRYVATKVFFFLFNLYCLLVIRVHWLNMVARKEADEESKIETA